MTAAGFTTVLVTVGAGPAPATAGTAGVQVVTYGHAGYRAKIQRAAYGVPHITASSFANLGFGAAVAQAEDNVCIMAEQMVTVDATRSRFFGVTGPADPNIRSDLFFQKAKDDRIVEQVLVMRPDGINSPSRQARDLLRGFAAGYNSYLRRVGVDNITDPACTGKPWVRPITEADLWRGSWASAIRAGSRALLDGIVAAEPPAPGVEPATAAVPDPAAMQAAIGGAGGPIGSNAYGLGRAATADGVGGMLLANPHFPWQGPDRFYRQHLKIPGVYDAEGEAIIGHPIVEIGHNATLAWSHTVSTARRFTWQRLTLAPGDPTAYQYDGTTEKMTRRDVTVQVPDGAGGTAPVTRTFYGTRFGPVVVVPGSMPWTATTAYAITDVNAANFRLVEAG